MVCDLFPARHGIAGPVDGARLKPPPLPCLSSQARNAVGWSMPSGLLKFKTQAAPPAAVEQLRVGAVTESSIELIWTAAVDNGSPITCYRHVSALYAVPTPSLKGRPDTSLHSHSSWPPSGWSAWGTTLSTLAATAPRTLSPASRRTASTSSDCRRATGVARAPSAAQRRASHATCHLQRPS